ncbi:tetratricopeptide repeat protein [Flavobacterium sp. KACC 22761]|uniref:tetratricopeptide repeat protein n=1 Tax=Flavobacterium sp. KACC 22761 TaxID=3092665 RepID=UPI002A75A01D|nr:tetratricopeptide repeat protein [Flavobacterium sp. KACC 22761]WPO78096.1 tetratricopeptide repeat protein [Flavobacterium sp. KACC 22761]
MTFKKTVLSLLIAFSLNAFAQKEGYWDKERATTKEIIVSARDRIVLKTEDLPVGTTEIVYRITLLDENQQMANSLVSVLKSIPDPTGISQGSAGAVFLMSKISGDDTCTYSLFTSSETAKKYIEDGKIDKACYSQEEPLSKDAKRLSLDKSSCLGQNTSNIWFGFHSKNWLLKQKIVLEVVPWVDVKLNRGWNQDNKNEIISLCKTSTMAQKMANSDDFCVCILDKIIKQYRYTEFQKLLPIEKNKVYKDFGNACYKDADISKNVFNDLRSQASSLIKKQKYNEAIPKLNIIINEGKATALDYNSIGYCYILTKQYEKALKFLQEGEKLDNTELLVKLNLAHLYLVTNNYSDAKTIYKKYQDQNVTDSVSWKDKTKLDFAIFQKAGLPSKDFEKILKLYY